MSIDKTILTSQGKWIISLLGAIVVLLMVNTFQSFSNKQYQAMYISKKEINEPSRAAYNYKTQQNDYERTIQIPPAWNYEGTLMETELGVFILISK